MGPSHMGVSIPSSQKNLTKSKLTENHRSQRSNKLTKPVVPTRLNFNVRSKLPCVSKTRKAFFAQSIMKA
eukprot:2196820-Amphidinium_carterae.1